MLLVIQKRVPTHGTINKGGQEESCYLQHIFVIMKSLVSIGSQDWISKIQVKTSFQKQLYNECGQWKYSGGK